MTSKTTTDPLADERHEWDNAEHPVGKLRRVEVARAGVGEAKATLGVRFDPEVIDRLRQMADGQGVGVTQMVRSWVLERIAAEQTEFEAIQLDVLVDGEEATVRFDGRLLTTGHSNGSDFAVYLTSRRRLAVNNITSGAFADFDDPEAAGAASGWTDALLGSVAEKVRPARRVLTLDI